MRKEVKDGCEILGLNPLHVANDGKLIALVSPEVAESLAICLEENAYGRDACIFSEVKTEARGVGAMRSGFGGTHIVDTPIGEQLPRIC